ncbi:RsmB/NOP family class I SAM-dependent RNA methyltransferase [Pedobacter sp. HMF7647]|uniref:RsmB/NOP family class I SAM-dependent RNA methyltransferase n=2 Tax=Hufsiella arboris TaxID=2695275 RepID=A0A7K1Y9X2_9SPHI|nr:RsmB/NOP family class I SAM-dependent RNA methyltransferase [Hufsiella arboris]MXV51387.1 RsmB/NOP family class I SAM-dependent RNA methyltransferase [Hufsiella arboris]
MPLAKFLPVYFRANKQMGSSDRRTTSRLLYNYFRIGNACVDLPVEERLFISEFLCNQSSEFLEYFKPELHQLIAFPINQKIDYLEKTCGFKLDEVFPLNGSLSKSIDRGAFLESIFVQPDLFIRINPGKEKFVIAKLEQAETIFAKESEQTLRLPNGTKLDSIFEDSQDGLFEIQDLSSQRTGEHFQPNKWEAWWDACAASGGKSLLLYSQEPTVKLLVSDIRESVLNNLDKRFADAGLLKFQKKQLDLLKNVDPELHHYEFDGVILDAPCTGSGTWGRTPEMISQFEDHRISFFQSLQKGISANVVKYLKPGKPLIYITCSVFKEENEEVVSYLETLGLTLEKSEILKGYAEKADTMFVARLVKNKD